MARGKVGGIARLETATVVIQAIGAGEADMAAGELHQLGQHAGHRRGVAGAGNADQGDAAVSIVREQVFDDGPADSARLAGGRAQVHEQAWAGVDFDDGATLFFQRTGDVFAHEVDAGDVEADHAGGERHGGGNIRVDFVSAVKGHVAVALDQDRFAGRWHGVAGITLAGQFKAGCGIEAGEVERVVFGAAAARVGVDLAGDQFVDRRLAVAGDPGFFAAGCGHQLAADHQQTVFEAGDEAFDDDAAAFFDGHAVGLHDFVAGMQVGEHAAAVVAVIGFDDNRQADVFGGFPGFFGVLDVAAFRYRNAAGRQQLFGQVLVTRNAFGNGAGLVGLRRPDAAQCAPVTELHQVAGVQADIGDVAVVCRIDDAGGRGAEAVVVHHVAQALDRGSHVKRAVFHGGEHQLPGGEQGFAGDVFMPGPHDDLVLASFGEFTGLAESARHASEVLQLEGDVFEDVPGPGAFFQAAQESSALFIAATVFDEGRQP